MTEPKLDIWGDPVEGKRECFHCGEYYLIANSSASDAYRGTYCSRECQEKDTLSLKMAAEAEARFTNHETEPAPPAEQEQELKIGDFRIKVRKEQP